MSDELPVLPLIGDAAREIVDLVAPVFDDQSGSTVSALVWLDSRPGLGSQLIMEEALHRLVEGKPGWAISSDVDDGGWSRVGFVKRGLSQPRPDTRVDIDKPWVCLTLDGLKRKDDDGVSQLLEMLGVLTVAANMWKAGSEDQLSKKEALKQIARGSGEVVANKAVGTLASMIPVVGGFASLGIDIVTSIDREALRALKPSLRLGRSRRSDAEVPEEELLIGGMVASQLLDVVETFDSATSRVPVVVMVRDAQLVKTEVEAFLAQLLGDERSASRNVAVIVSTTTPERVEWLEQLCSVDSDSETDVSATRSTRFVHGHAMAGPNEHRIGTINAEGAEAIVKWFAPTDAIEAGVPARMVERSSLGGRVSIDLLLEYIEEAAARHSTTGFPLTVAWAEQLTSKAAKAAAEAVSTVFSRRPDDASADVLSAMVGLGGQLNSSIMSEINRECGDVGNRAVDALVAAGIMVVNRAGVVRVVNQSDMETAIDAELARQGAGERAELEAKIGRAAANWLSATATDLESGAVGPSEALSDVGTAIRRGLGVPSTNGKLISPRMRLVLTRPGRDSDESEEWFNAARNSLVSAKAVRDEGWVVLAHAVVTMDENVLPRSATVLRDAIAGEALGYLADPAGCPSVIRHHWAARALVRWARRRRSNHVELGERAAVTMLADFVPGLADLLGDLPTERVRDLFETLVTSPPSGMRDFLIERCAGAGIDPHEALRVLIRDASSPGGAFEVETALAIARLSDGIDDDTLDSLCAERPLSVDESESADASVLLGDPDSERSAAEPAVEAIATPSSIRRNASSLLSHSLAGLAEDPKRSQLVRGAMARIALSSGNAATIEASYLQLLADADKRADGALLCRLAENLSREHRLNLLDSMRSDATGADRAIAMARLCHEEDQPPAELTQQLRRHQRNPRCTAHLLRFQAAEEETASAVRRLRQSVREGESAGLEELYDFRDRDRRVLPLLAQLLGEADDERASLLLEALHTKIGRVDEASPHEVVAILNLAKCAGSDKQKSAVRSAAEIALDPTNGWESRDREAACRALVSTDARDLVSRAQRSEAIKRLEAAVESVDNVIALTGALRRAVAASVNHRSRSGNRRPVGRGDSARRLDIARHLLVNHGTGQTRDVEAALEAFIHFERDLSEKERREVWRTIERHVVRDPRLALRVRRAAHKSRYINDAERWIAFHALVDPECALHVVRSSMSDGELVDAGMVANLVLWAQSDPRIAASLAQLFSVDAADQGGGDILDMSQRRQLRQALVRHARESSRCALALVLGADPNRAELDQVYDYARLGARSLDWAIVMCRSATTPGRAVEAVEHLRLAVQRVRDDRDLSSIQAKAGVKGVPTLEAFVEIVHHRYRKSRTTEYREAVGKCLSAAKTDVDHHERARRMVSFALALSIHSTRHRYSQHAGIKGKDEAKKATREIVERSLNVMLAHTRDPNTCAPFLPTMLKLRVNDWDRQRIMGTVVRHVRRSEYPSSIAVHALFSEEMKTAASPADRRRDGDDWKKTNPFFNAAKSDPTALAVSAILGSVRNGTSIDLSSLARRCRGRRARAAAIVEYIRLTEIDHPELCDDQDRGRIPFLVRDFLRDWDEPLGYNDHMSQLIGHRCVARTEGIDHSGLLVVRSRALVEIGDRERLVALLPQLRDRVDDPDVALALGRVATSSFDLERVREVLFARAADDPLYASELMRLGITWRRRRELFAVVSGASYESDEERAVLLGMLASDNQEKRLAQSALDEVSDPTSRSLELQATLSDYDPEFLDALVGMRDGANDEGERSRLTCAMIPYYEALGGFAVLGQTLLEWLGKDSEDSVVGLEILRTVAGDHVGSVVLRDEERSEVVQLVLAGVVDGSVPLDQALTVLSEDEIGRSLLDLLERHRDERLVVPLVYRFGHLHDPDRVSRALERFWARSTESIFAALWLLEERDMDDQRFSAAWNQLASMAMTSPRLLVRLAQFSKRPLAQLALCQLLLGVQMRGRRSEAVQRFGFRAQRELLGYERGSPSRRRRLIMAATTVHPTRINREMARKELLSKDSTAVELAAVALTNPDKVAIDELRSRIKNSNDGPAVLMRALLLGGRVDSLPVTLATETALLFDDPFADDGMVRNAVEILEVAQLYSLNHERSRIYRALIARESIPQPLIKGLAESAPQSMLADVVRILEEQEPQDEVAVQAALRIARNRLERQRERRVDGPTGNPSSTRG